MRNAASIIRLLARRSRVFTVILAQAGMATTALLAQTGVDTEPVIAEGIVELETQHIVEDIYRDAHSDVETFDLRTERQVDLLFVIDNSNTMSAEQELLARSFGAFISQFTKRNLDFHIGAITMEKNDGRLVRRNHWPRPWLARDTVNLEKEFIWLTHRGTKGSAAETAFLPIIEALENPENSGFFRPDALLSIVIVSDEDESIGGKRREYLREDETALRQRLFDLQLKLITVKMGKKGLIRLDAVTGPDPVPADCTTKISGIALSKAAAMFGGQTISICEDFSDELIAAGDSISQVAQRRFSLRNLPIVSTIQLRINDQVIEKNETNGWTLDFDANAIDLHGEALKRSFGSVVSISYQWLEDPSKKQGNTSTPEESPADAADAAAEDAVEQKVVEAL